MKNNSFVYPENITTDNEKYEYLLADLGYNAEQIKHMADLRKKEDEQRRFYLKELGCNPEQVEAIATARYMK